MTRSGGDDRLRAQAAQSVVRRRAGIYGAIITASIMTAAGDSLGTVALAVPLVITLVVYWLAEQYADVLAEQTEAGGLPTSTASRPTSRAPKPS